MVKQFRHFFLITLLIVPATLYSTPRPQSAADVKVSGWASPDKTRRGRSVQANVQVEIPAGLHVQSSRPLDKFLVATKLEIEPPAGVRVSAPIYPRAVMRNFKFSKGKVAVYEGRAVIRFNVTVPANFKGNSAEIKGRLRFQACNDESCFPPVTRDVSVWVNVE
ncbi:MAG TPA: protein-disulfide reductase DsbD N-terminal domain-containing protein [Pyrinomonadaceae bacterium]|jgi:thiol:disulfide interchange protein DsbD